MAVLSETIAIETRSPLAQRSGAGVRVKTTGAFTRHDLEYRNLVPVPDGERPGSLIAVQNPDTGRVYSVPFSGLSGLVPSQLQAGVGIRVRAVDDSIQHDLDYRDLAAVPSADRPSALVAVQSPTTGQVYKVPCAGLLGTDISQLQTTLVATGAVARSFAQRAGNVPSVSDFGGSTSSAAFAAARAAAGTTGITRVYEQATPATSVGDADASWLMEGRGARTPLDNLLGAVIRLGRRHDTRAYPRMTGSTVGGFFSSYDCTGAFSVVDRHDYGKTILNRPFIIDGGFFHVVDADKADHPETAGADNNRAITNAVRALIVGPDEGGAIAKQYKDLVALDAHSIGRIDAPLRGCSGIAVGAIQFGRGVTSNEMAAQNPSPADFGLPMNSWEQSVSMAASQSILRPHYADADATHIARAALVGNDQGFLATAGVDIYSASHGSIPARDGAFARVLEMGNAIARDAAIRMPRSRAGSTAGTLIEYNPNTYTDFVRETNTFRWVVAGNVIGVLEPTGIDLNGLNVVGQVLAGQRFAPAHLYLGSSTTAKAQLRFGIGVAPTASESGDFWFDGAALRINIGGTVRTITVT